MGVSPRVAATTLVIFLMEATGPAWPSRTSSVKEDIQWTRGPGWSRSQAPQNSLEAELFLGKGTGFVKNPKLSNPVAISEQPPTGAIQPQFSSNTTVSVFAPRGGTASIECRVNNLGDRAVSWMRVRDLHILTIGSITYTADRRFTSTQSEDSRVWRLTIHPTMHSDAGMYECQISTEPKISKLQQLNITDAVATISSGRSVYMLAGSLLNVTCVTHGQVTPASQVLWYRGTHLLNSASRGGVSINTDKVQGVSNLVIWKSRLSDTGLYSCRPSNSLPDTVSIHILTGGDLAAIQEPEGLTGGTLALRGATLQVLLSCCLLLWRR